MEAEARRVGGRGRRAPTQLPEVAAAAAALALRSGHRRRRWQAVGRSMEEVEDAMLKDAALKDAMLPLDLTTSGRMERGGGQRRRAQRCRAQG
jgi:hypothetical protein